MKILYAIQGTGNGHLSRAGELLPLIRNFGQVDVLISGTQAEIQLDYPVKYRFRGLSFVFGKKGGIDYWASFSEANLIRLFGEIEKVPVQNYDLVINDFEPVTAWACAFRKVPCIAFGHQASLLMHGVPLPSVNDSLGKFVLRNYAPAHDAVGFHFDVYTTDVFTPVIRKAIANAQASDKNYFTVYLPAYDDVYVASLLSSIKGIRWQIFSKKGSCARVNARISVEPINSERFAESMVHSTGVLTGAGFETPAEALFLGKKLLVVPMIGQYEQQCNAASLKLLGVPVVQMLNKATMPVIADWVFHEDAIKVNWEPLPKAGIDLLFQKFGQLQNGTIPPKFLRSNVRRLFGANIYDRGMQI